LIRTNIHITLGNIKLRSTLAVCLVFARMEDVGWLIANTSVKATYDKVREENQAGHYSTLAACTLS
jgi:hypothetical protein